MKLLVLHLPLAAAGRSRMVSLRLPETIGLSSASPKRRLAFAYSGLFGKWSQQGRLSQRGAGGLQTDGPSSQQVTSVGNWSQRSGRPCGSPQVFPPKGQGSRELTPNPRPLGQECSQGFSGHPGSRAGFGAGLAPRSVLNQWLQGWLWPRGEACWDDFRLERLRFPSICVLGR